ncbi:MAG: endolytic transglycosylase MltG [Prevotella sp.]|nr:endolytic transglycosylase MltG [Prevotella sp.]
MKSKLWKKVILSLAAFLLITGGISYYYLFTSFTHVRETFLLLIDDDDTVDSVFTKLSPVANERAMNTLEKLISYSGYAQNIRSGRYAIASGEGTFTVFRKLKNGLQDPVRLTIPSVRTVDRLSAEISKHMMMDSTMLRKALTDEATCKKVGLNTNTILCLFIPNTYELFWNTSVDKFLERMKKESDNFWEGENREKAARLRLSPNEVITLASIVDEETSNNAEKPMIAGMYYNRLMLRNKEYPQGMPLQADPTVKYALGQFHLKRIYKNMLQYNSPYNTYINVGLPPGPIRIPTLAGINAVLNLKRHNYLYMCAKEDFSGTHNFAKDYEEHLANAAKYAEALNKRGIQ